METEKILLIVAVLVGPGLIGMLGKWIFDLFRTPANGSLKK